MDWIDVPSDLNLTLRREVLEVLATEGNDLLLSNEKSKLVETFLGELRNLHTLYYGAEVRGDILHGDTILEQVGLLGISTKTRIREF